MIPVFSGTEYSFPLDWKDSIEPDNDNFTYTLILSDNEEFENPIKSSSSFY